MSKITEEEARANPDKYRINEESGAIYNLETRLWVGNTGKSKWSLTPQRAQELAQIRKAKKLRAEVLGIIDATRKFQEEKNLPLVIPEPGDLDSISDEELYQFEGNADRLLSYLFRLAFLKEADKIATGTGGNFRGLGEAYRATKTEREEKPGITANIQTNIISSEFAELTRSMMKIIDDVMAVKAGQVIDTQAQDVTKPFGGQVFTAQQGAEDA